MLNNPTLIALMTMGVVTSLEFVAYHHPNAFWKLTKALLF